MCNACIWVSAYSPKTFQRIAFNAYNSCKISLDGAVAHMLLTYAVPVPAKIR